MSLAAIGAWGVARAHTHAAWPEIKVSGGVPVQAFTLAQGPKAALDMTNSAKPAGSP